MKATLSARKVAILVVAIQPDAARALMQHLFPEERAAIAIELGRLRLQRATFDEVETVLREFRSVRGVSHECVEVNDRSIAFEDLVWCDEEGMLKLLKDVEGAQLALALKVPAPRVAARIFALLPGQAACALQQEMDTLGPVFVREVAAARREIEVRAQRLEFQGSLAIERSRRDAAMV